MNYERVTVVFLFAVTFGMFAMSFYSLSNRSQCQQTALSQNYPAEYIKKICN